MSRAAGSEGGLLGTTRRDSFSRLAISDGLVRVGTAGLAAATIGFFDDAADAIVMAVIAGVALAIGISGRRTFVRRRHTAAARILSGLASTWAVMVLVGMATYLATGAIDTVDGALFESAAGFSAFVDAEEHIGRTVAILRSTSQT